MAKNFLDEDEDSTITPDVPEVETAEPDMVSSEMAVPEQEIASAHLDEGALKDLEMAARPQARPSWMDTYNKYLEAKGRSNPESELAQAQADKRKMDNIALASLAGGQISQGFASMGGGKIGNNKEAYDAFRSQGDRKLSEVKERQDNVSNMGNMASSDLKLMNEGEVNDPDSDVSKFTRQQAYAFLDKIDPDGTKGYQALKGNLEKMSAAQLQKIPGFKDLMKAQSGGKTLQQGQFITKGGDPAMFDPNSGKYINAVTGQPVTETGSLYRPVMYNDAFGNRAVMGPQGNIQVSSSKRGPEQFTKMEPKAEEQAATSFSPDEKQRQALDKEKERVDGMVKAANGQIGQINGLLKALDTNSKMAKGVAVNALVRAAGETGPLSESDKAPFQGSSALLDRMKQYMDTNVSSELTPENKAEMKKLIGIYLTTASDTKNGIYNNSSQSLAQIHNIPPSFTRKALGDIKPMSKPQERILEKEKVKDEKREAKQANIVTIQGPSGQTVQMEKTKAEKYLSQPGYKLIQGQ